MYDTRDSGSKTPAQRAADAYKKQKEQNKYGTTTGGTVRSNNPAKQAAANYNSQRASGNYGTTTGGTVSTGTKLATGTSSSSNRSRNSSRSNGSSYVASPVKTTPVMQTRARTSSFSTPSVGKLGLGGAAAAVAAYTRNKNALLSNYYDDEPKTQNRMKQSYFASSIPDNSVADAVASYNAQKASGNYGTTNGTNVVTMPYQEKKNPYTGAEPVQYNTVDSSASVKIPVQTYTKPQSWGYTQDQINGLNSIGIQPYDGSTGWGKYISQQDLETHPGVANAIANNENENHQVVDMYGNYMTLGELYYYMAKGFYDKVDGNQGWGMVGGTGRGTSYDPDTGWQDTDGIDDSTGQQISGWQGFSSSTPSASEDYESYDPYGDAMDALQSQYDLQVSQQNNSLKDALQQAYISKMLAERDLPQQMSASGLNGGAAESTMANLYNTYLNNRSSLQNTANDNLTSIRNSYLTNLANLEAQQAEAAEKARQDELDRQLEYAKLQAQQAKTTASSKSSSGTSSSKPRLTAAQAKSAYDGGDRSSGTIYAMKYYYGDDWEPQSAETKNTNSNNTQNKTSNSFLGSVLNSGNSVDNAIKQYAELRRLWGG